MVSLLEQLIGILKLLKVRPASGYGRTIIVWTNGEIKLIIKEEEVLPENIN